MDKVQKLGNKRKCTLFSLFSRLNSCIYPLWSKTLNLHGRIYIYIFFFYKVSNLQKREKDVNCLLEIIWGISKTRGYCYDTRITLTAPARQKDRSSGNENENRPFFLIFRSCAVRFAIVFARNLSREILHYVSGSQFAHKFHRCVLCSNFRMTFYVFFIIFCVLVFILLSYLYHGREVRNIILLRHIYECISITWSIVTDVLVAFRYSTFPK